MSLSAMSLSMSFHVGQAERLAEFVDQLHARENLTADLMSSVAATICALSPAPDRMRSSRIDRLVAAGAWTDAALALVDGELPQWKLRRLVYDDGRWHCALSRQRELPEWLDQAIETSHVDCAAAVLAGVVEAARQSAPADVVEAGRVPRIPLKRDELICCDNFA